MTLLLADDGARMGRTVGHLRGRHQRWASADSDDQYHDGEGLGSTLAQELFAFSRGHPALYKIPRILEFVPELPKPISGKIRRVELRAQEA